MSSNTILVTGGAGYIGSHVVKQLGDRGEQVVVVDNLVTGFRDAVLYGTFVEGDVGNIALMEETLRRYNVDTVMHFAASTVVPESVENPLKYYRNNTANTRSLLEACQNVGVKHFIFSSTAAVYGEPEQALIDESAPTQPINPYGMSKLMSETMLRDLSKACPMRHVILRYFNVAGSDPQGRIGQSTRNATLLTKVAAEAAVGKREHVYVFGTDYPTADGTGVRDYIHVEDLADAHLRALDYLRKGGASVTANAGYGHGFSVREVLNAVERVTGTALRVIDQPRRAGDPPALMAKCDKIRNLLGWVPRYDDLDTILKTAIAWERQLLEKSQA